MMVMLQLSPVMMQMELTPYHDDGEPISRYDYTNDQWLTSLTFLHTTYQVTRYGGER